MYMRYKMIYKKNVAVMKKTERTKNTLRRPDRASFDGSNLFFAVQINPTI